MPLSPRGKGGDDILNSDRLPFSSFSFANCCFSSIVFFKRELSVQITSLWIPFPYLCDLTRVNSLRLPRKSYRIGGLLFTKKGDFNAWSARLWRLERIQELCVNEISMLYSCAVSSGAPNEDVVQNHLTQHCWTYFSIQTVDIGIFLYPKNFSSVRIS